MLPLERDFSLRFVTSFIGNRDSYQVPLALHERKLLTRHVCDFYTPDLLHPLAKRIAPRILRRSQLGLPSSRTEWNFSAIWRQVRDPYRKHDSIRMAYD